MSIDQLELSCSSGTRIRTVYVFEVHTQIHKWNVISQFFEVSIANTLTKDHQSISTGKQYGLVETCLVGETELISKASSATRTAQWLHNVPLLAVSLVFQVPSAAFLPIVKKKRTWCNFIIPSSITRNFHSLLGGYFSSKVRIYSKRFFFYYLFFAWL